MARGFAMRPDNDADDRFIPKVKAAKGGTKKGGKKPAAKKPMMPMAPPKKPSGGKKGGMFGY